MVSFIYLVPALFVGPLGQGSPGSILLDVSVALGCIAVLPSVGTIHGHSEPPFALSHPTCGLSP